MSSRVISDDVTLMNTGYTITKHIPMTRHSADDRPCKAHQRVECEASSYLSAERSFSGQTNHGRRPLEIILITTASTTAIAAKYMIVIAMLCPNPRLANAPS